MNHFLRIGFLVVLFPLINSNAVVHAQDTQAKENPAKAATAEQPNLSGVYEGVVDYPDGGLRADGELTIDGDEFVLLAMASSESTGSTEIKGRIITNRTANYIAAVMVFGDAASPTIISVRAILKDRSLTLTSVPGEKRAFSFTGGLRVRNRPHRKHIIAEGERTRPPSPARVEPTRLPSKRSRVKPNP